MGDMPFDLAALRAAMRRIESVAPKPFFASFSLLPRDHAISFERNGRSYCGAHPDFWKQIPASSRGQYESLWAIEIVDFDAPCNRERKVEFFEALSTPAQEGRS